MCGEIVELYLLLHINVAKGKNKRKSVPHADIHDCSQNYFVVFNHTGALNHLKL